MKVYKCIYCNTVINVDQSNKKGPVSARNKMGKHYDTMHTNLLPSDMDGYRYFYYLLTKKDRGSCVECHNETEFNRVAMKYARFCNNPACKQKYKETRDKRMMGKYGKVYLLDDPEFQKKMMAGRKIGGVYTWSDGKTQFPYLSSYELHFLKYLDEQLKWPVSDIMAPSPHTYTYTYNDKSHFYIPDFYIPSLSMEVEIKDDGSALNINSDSREKDRLKDELMRSLSNVVNYIKIVNKDYTEFEKIIKSA